MQQSATQVAAPRHGDLRKQLTSVLAGIAAQGLKVEDVVAEEMLDHLPGLTELAATRNYIVELEGREQVLQTQNDELLAKLKAKETELLDQPGNIQALEMELQQAQRHIEIYKTISEDASNRADRLQKKLDNVQSKQRNFDLNSAKVGALQTQLHEQLSDYQKLVSKHNEASEAAGKQREHFQHAFNTQREHLQGIINQKTDELSDALLENTRIEAESQALSDAYTSIIEAQEIDHADVLTSINDKAVQLRQAELTYKSIQAEIEPLKEFSIHAADILEVYQKFAHALLNPTSESTHIRLGEEFDTLMDHMQDDIQLYIKAVKEPVSGRAPHAVIREYTDKICKHNRYLWDALYSIHTDIIAYTSKCRPRNPPASFASRFKKVFSKG
ncbi:hypothetical protein NX059_010109 [Plenodomus lindquistii]|nr:hypothetical protein NX059_010109 [Plenodomus lindquistii]